MRWDAARQREWVEHHDGPQPDNPEWSVLAFIVGAIAGFVIVAAYVYHRTH